MQKQIDDSLGVGEEIRMVGQKGVGVPRLAGLESALHVVERLEERRIESAVGGRIDRHWGSGLKETTHDTRLSAGAHY